MACILSWGRHELQYVLYSHYALILTECCLYSSARDLLIAYNEKNGIEPADPFDQKQASTSDSVPVYKLDMLGRILSVQHLASELDDLRKGGLTMAKEFLKKGKSNNELAKTLIGHINSNNVIGSLLDFSVSNSQSLASLSVLQLNETIQAYPMLSAASHKLQVEMRAWNQDLARSLIIMYRWLRYTGPGICHAMAKAYCEKGMQQINSHYGKFACLLAHVVLFVDSVAESVRTRKKQKTATTAQKRGKVGEKWSQLALRT